jgi:hypothetical protein
MTKLGKTPTPWLCASVLNNWISALSLRGFDNQNLGAYTNAFSPKVFKSASLLVE